MHVEFTKKCNSRRQLEFGDYIPSFNRGRGGAEGPFCENKWLLGKINGPLGEWMGDMIIL